MDERVLKRIHDERQIIAQKKQEMQTAGKIHRADLQREINRRKKELRIYIEYHRRQAEVSC